MADSESVRVDLASLSSGVAALLVARRHTIAVAESSAAGLISAALVAVPGASAFYLGGAVVYTRAARSGLLAIEDKDMEGMRASTEAYALLKARRIRERLGATWGLSETGASGPTGNLYGDAAGHACIAVAVPVERALTLEPGKPDREANRGGFTRAALQLLGACIGETRA